VLCREGAKIECGVAWGRVGEKGLQVIGGKANISLIIIHSESAAGKAAGTFFLTFSSNPQLSAAPVKCSVF
jgi:hypothetical protein